MTLVITYFQLCTLSLCSIHTSVLLIRTLCVVVLCILTLCAIFNLSIFVYINAVFVLYQREIIFVSQSLIIHLFEPEVIISMTQLENGRNLPN